MVQDWSARPRTLGGTPLTASATTLDDRAALVRQLIDDLTAAAIQRFGADHAARLRAGIESTAETLALVTRVSFAHDDAEPDAGSIR